VVEYSTEPCRANVKISAWVAATDAEVTTYGGLSLEQETICVIIAGQLERPVVWPSSVQHRCPVLDQ